MKETLVLGLAQPDQRSCGASSLVAARMLLDPRYAAQVAGRPSGFATDALATHRRVTGIVDARGVLQVPWPRILGTPPWAVARQMSILSGADFPAVDYDTHLVLANRDRLFGRMAEACASGRPVPFYVGDRWLPRHVVLAVGPAREGLRVYNPAHGSVITIRTPDFVASTLPFGRWRKPWFVVLPD
jgi:hypothetical protein